MEFAFVDPPPPLAGTVKAIWIARGSRQEFANPDPIVPDGCVEFVFNTGDPFVDAATGAEQPRALLAGQMTRPVVALPTGGVDLIGVRLRTSQAGAALRLPMHHLQDALLDAGDVDPAVGRLADEARNVDAGRRVAHVLTALSSRLHPARRNGPDAIDHALAMIDRRRGQVAIDTVARAVGVSRRHLERRFRDEVGLGVKHVARIARVHAVLRLINRGTTLGGAAMAAACGFSDQAHLIRECRALTGRTPAALTSPGRSLSGLMREAT